MSHLNSRTTNRLVHSAARVATSRFYVCSVSVLAFVTTSLTSLAFAPTAAAQGFAVNQLEPAERGSEAFAMDTLDFRGHLRPAIGVLGDYAYQPLAIYGTNGNVRTAVVENQLFAHLGASLVLWERLRLGVNAPFQLVANGDTGSLRGTVYPPPKGDVSPGDIRLGADLRLVGRYGDPFRLAAGVRGWLPSGDPDKYAGDGSGRFGGRVLAAGDVGKLVYAAQAGVSYRAQDAVVAGGALGSDVAFGAFVGLRLAAGKLVVGPEIFGRTVLSNSGAFEKRSTPLEGLLGAHYQLGDDWRIGAGVGTGITRGFGAPTARGLLSIEWAPGIKKEEPILPPAEPAPPRDSDGDGIPDSEDACPAVPGVKSDDPKANGCPSDKDHDGIADADDACPDVAGVKTSDPKTNGCPPDADKDGILDSEDACPDVPGIKTSDPKTNGCPDPDRDKDGIPNEADACPDEPGKADPDPKKNGCPKAFVKDGQIKILDQVKFATGSAAIVPGKESTDVLEAVRALLTAHPEIKKIRVEGHTDNQGSAKINTKLSADRAAAVVKWLVAHKIEASRLTSEGFGPDKPIETNSTADGRKANRRVEFHIVEKADQP